MCLYKTGVGSDQTLQYCHLEKEKSHYGDCNRHMGGQRFIPHPRRVLPRTSCSLWGIANECGSVLAISRVSNGSICFGLSQFTVLVRSSAQGQLRRIPVSHTTSKLANLMSSVPSLPISSCSSSCSWACLNCASKEWACFLWDGSYGNRSGGDPCWVC
jgi:hypothetical protein